jgi:hypothetical protein
MCNITMDHPSLKPDSSILFKSSFIRTVKYNNFVLYDLSVYNCGPEKSRCYPEKKKCFALKRKTVALKRACCGEEEEEEECCCCFCHGAQNISVTNKSEEFCVKICIST